MKHRVVLVVHDIRSCHNVGSLFRSAEGLGVDKLYLTGYTPYPKQDHDARLPHLADKISRQIQKTALGAEQTLPWAYYEDSLELLDKLKAEDYEIVGLEQTPTATKINNFKPRKNVALIVGSEVGGLDKMVLEACDEHLEIPMRGQKESFNVAVAAAIALYHIQNLT